MFRDTMATVRFRAIGAVGSALPSHGRGHRFESGIAHSAFPHEGSGNSYLPPFPFDERTFLRVPAASPLLLLSLARPARSASEPKKCP